MNVGIVGCGRIATLVHLPSLTKLDKVEVKAAVDTDMKRLEETLEKFHIEEGYADSRLMLKKADVDAVFVCAPPQHHFQIVMDSIKHNKHVFCEKPLSNTVEEALTIKETLEKRNKTNSDSLVLMPGHNFIFTPVFDAALQLVKDGEVGNLQRIMGCAASNLMFYQAKTDFRIRAKGGVIEDQLPHVIYLCHDVGGSLESVLSIDTHRRKHSFMDNVDVKLELSNGIQANLSARWSGLVPALKFDLIGDSGQIKLDLLRTPYNITVIKGESRTIHMGRRIRQVFDVLRNKHPSYRLQHFHFLNCVEGVEEARVTVDDGVNLVRTLSEIMAVFEKSPYSPVGREKACIVKVEEDVENAIHNSINLLGGLNIGRDQRVVIKPNVCYHSNVDNMIITDFRVLEAVIDLVRKRTDNIIVVESDSVSGTAEKRMEHSGVLDIIKKCDVDFLNLSKDDVEEHKVDDLVLEIPKTLLKADFVVNVPKLKTNDLVSISVAMKNMFGVLSNKKKSKFHKSLAEVLVYLNRFLRQDLIVVDGIVGMEGLGPIYGSPVKLGLIISGLDAITVDAVCCHVMGINPYAVEPLWKAYAAGVGEIDIERIQVIGETIDNVKTKFRLPFLNPENIFVAIKTRLKLI